LAALAEAFTMEELERIKNNEWLEADGLGGFSS
jgi:hypothetical protein